MATVQKFLFDTSFDEPGNGPTHKVAIGPLRDADTSDEPVIALPGDAEPYAGLDRRRRVSDAPSPEPLPDLYTAAQLDAAREEGYLKGHASALEEAGASTARLAAKALKGIAAALEHLDDSQHVFNASLEKMAIRLALAMVRQVLPATVEANAAPEIQRLLADALPDVLDQPRLVIRVHGSLAEAIRKAVGPLQEDHAFDGRITVRPDNDLPVGDCRLEWGDGGIERDTLRLWADIEAAVARHLDEPVPPPPDSPQGTPADAIDAMADMSGNTAPTRDDDAAPNVIGGARVDMERGMEQGEHHG